MNQNRFILIQIILFVATAQLAMALYLPSLPAITATFKVSNSMMQQSFSLFMLAYGISQLFYGAFSDRYGRRPLLLCGMLILFLGTVWAIFAPSILSFLLARLIEGLGAGSAAVLARSIISDRFKDNNMPKAMSMMVFSVSITPAITPFIGGLFQEYLNWRSIFVFLAICLLILIVFIFLRMPETNQHKKTYANEKTNISHIVKDYCDLLRNKLFICYVGIIILGFSSQLLYLSISPFILQIHFHVASDAYGRLMVLPAIAYIIGNYVSAQLNQHIHYSKIIFMGTIISLFGGVLLTIISASQNETAIYVVSCITIINAAYGFIASNAVIGAISPFEHMAGTASSVLGFLQMVGSSLLVTIVSFFFNGTSLTLGTSFIIISASMLMLTSLIIILHKNEYSLKII